MKLGEELGDIEEDKIRDGERIDLSSKDDMMNEREIIPKVFKGEASANCDSQRSERVCSGLFRKSAGSLNR